MVIDCKKIADKFWEDNKKRIFDLNQKNIIPKFAIIHINDSEASQKYVNKKIKKAEELKIEYEIFHQKTILEDELINVIHKFNQDNKVHGILIQLPLPKHIDLAKVISAIDIKKDIDGFHYLNPLSPSERLINIPCTPLGILKILEAKKVSLESKNIVIINRSIIVGKPLTNLFLAHNATVTICHSKTKNLKMFTQNADIIIVAVGIPFFLTKKMVNKKAIIIDVGINVHNNKIVGDACFDQLKDYVKYITPVPNGVGQLTLAMFFNNLIKLIENKQKEI